MRTWNLRQSVNVSIILSFIGLLVAFPFQQSFIGGLLFAAFCAATIGGLADSFAVSAIFGQPLKIRWPAWLGTNIIARNRDRLIDELVVMVEQELLSTEMIRKQLQHYDAATVIIQYVKSVEGKQVIKELFYRLLSDLLKVSNPTVLSLSLNRLIKQGLQNSSMAHLLSDIMNWSVKHKYDQSLIKVLAKQLRLLLEKPGIKGFLHEFIATALRSYEQDKKGRKFVNGVAGLNANELTEKLLKIADNTLIAMQEENHPMQQKIQQYIINFSNNIQQNEGYAAAISERLGEMLQRLTSSMITKDSITRTLQQLQEQLLSDDDLQKGNKLRCWLDMKIDELLTSISSEESLLERINQYIKDALMQFVERNHAYIGQLVRNKLDQFDEEELIALIHEKTAKDLQYIRLNGTAVGALIGILLYIIQFSIGGLLS